jgi:hypothetical protein
MGGWGGPVLNYQASIQFEFMVFYNNTNWRPEPEMDCCVIYQYPPDGNGTYISCIFKNNGGVIIDTDWDVEGDGGIVTFIDCVIDTTEIKWNDFITWTGINLITGTTFDICLFETQTVSIIGAAGCTIFGLCESTQFSPVLSESGAVPTESAVISGQTFIGSSTPDVRSPSGQVTSNAPDDSGKKKKSSIGLIYGIVGGLVVVIAVVIVVIVWRWRRKKADKEDWEARELDVAPEVREILQGDDAGDDCGFLPPDTGEEVFGAEEFGDDVWA